MIRGALGCAQNDMRGGAEWHEGDVGGHDGDVGDDMMGAQNYVLGLQYDMGYGVLDVMMSRRQRAVLCRRGLRLGKCM